MTDATFTIRATNYAWNPIRELIEVEAPAGKPMYGVYFDGLLVQAYLTLERAERAVAEMIEIGNKERERAAQERAKTEALAEYDEALAEYDNGWSW